MLSAALKSSVISLRHAKGRTCRRLIKDTDLEDLYQPNPLYICKELRKVPNDFAELNGPVSLTLRTHAFQSADVAIVQDAFDFCRKFKTHYVTDIDKPWRDRVHRNANRYDRRSRNIYRIEKSENATGQALRLLDLHNRVLSRAGSIRRAPDMNAVTTMLSQPNVFVFEAVLNSSVEGLAVYVRDEDFVFAHILGTTDSARENGVIYGLYGAALDYFTGRAAALDFGGNPGALDDTENGISKFKALWATRTEQSFLLGKVLDSEKYAELSAGLSSGYFPAYRGQ